MTLITGPLLEEAVALADAAQGDDTERAEARGWRPLTENDLGPVATFEDGIQEGTVGTEGGEKFTTVAHAYLGEVDGETVVALAFRGIDQNSGELLFALDDLDAYYEEHEGLIDAVTRFAAEGLEDETVDRLLVTGHSLGGTLTETTAALGLDDPLVREATTALTFGSPGSTAVAPEDVELVNLVHTDDPIANIGELQEELPNRLLNLLPGDAGDTLDDLERGGEDILVERPEGRPVERGDLDELAELLFDSGDWEEEAFLVEHDLDLYARTVRELGGDAIA
jgi:Lipase (class 3)